MSSFPVFDYLWSLFNFMSIESMMLSNHLILCCTLLLLPSIFPSIRVFSNEPALHISRPKCWSFSISPSDEYFRVDFLKDWLVLSLCSPRDSRVFSSATIQKHQFFSAQASILQLKEESQPPLKCCLNLLSLSVYISHPLLNSALLRAHF